MSEHRREEFSNALDGLVREFLRLGMNAGQIAAMLEWKAEYLKVALLNIHQREGE